MCIRDSLEAATCLRGAPVDRSHLAFAPRRDVRWALGRPMRTGSWVCIDLGNSLLTAVSLRDFGGVPRPPRPSLWTLGYPAQLALIRSAASRRALILSVATFIDCPFRKGGRTRGRALGTLPQAPRPTLSRIHPSNYLVNTPPEHSSWFLEITSHELEPQTYGASGTRKVE